MQHLGKTPERIPHTGKHAKYIFCPDATDVRVALKPSCSFLFARSGCGLGGGRVLLGRRAALVEHVGGDVNGAGRRVAADAAVQLDRRRLGRGSAVLRRPVLAAKQDQEASVELRRTRIGKCHHNTANPTSWKQRWADLDFTLWGTSWRAAQRMVRQQWWLSALPCSHSQQLKLLQITMVP